MFAPSEPMTRPNLKAGNNDKEQGIHHQEYFLNNAWLTQHLIGYYLAPLPYQYL